MLLSLFFIILIEGFVTISLEVLAIRQLIPFFGNSVIITSLIIGIFLLFLALGYWRGGKVKADFLNQLSKNFIFCFFLIGFCLSYLVIAVYYYYMMHVFQLPAAVILLVYLLFSIAPIVYLLGQTVPLTTNLFNQQRTVASISGQALFISTLGSFFGAVLTSLILFHFLGVGFTVFFNSLLLLLLIFYIQSMSNSKPLLLVALTLVLAGIYYINVPVEQVLFVKTNTYANYRINEDSFGKTLEINGSRSSYKHHNKKGFEYIEFIKNILFSSLQMKGKDILVIGAGGFSLSYENDYDNHFTYVDIDGDIKTVAEQHFLQDKIKGHFIAQDARVFLNKNKKRYDVIITDAYTSESSIPASLFTREYFIQLKSALKENGMMIANVIANPYYQDRFSKNVDNTIQSVFSYCSVSPIYWYNGPTNIIYLCSNQNGKASVYTDDRNTATLDFFSLMRK